MNPDRCALLLIFSRAEIDDLDTVATWAARDRGQSAHAVIRAHVAAEFAARGVKPAGKWPARARD